MNRPDPHLRRSNNGIYSRASGSVNGLLAASWINLTSIF